LIPGVLLISASILALQVFISNHQQWFPSILARADARLLALCLILGLSSWTGLCRLLRGEALKLRDVDFVQAAKSMGVSSMNIIVRH
jgi:peptide/nickel transport system permease protein